MEKREQNRSNFIKEFVILVMYIVHSSAVAEADLSVKELGESSAQLQVDENGVNSLEPNEACSDDSFM